jgi:hypothetical protein
MPHIASVTELGGMVGTIAVPHAGGCALAQAISVPVAMMHAKEVLGVALEVPPPGAAGSKPCAPMR